MTEMARDTLEKPHNPIERQKVVTFQFNVPTIDLKQIEVQPEALALIPLSLALEYSVLPITVENGTLTVAMGSPDDLQLIDTLAVLTNKKIKAAMPVGGNLRDVINHHYKTTSLTEGTLKDMVASIDKTTVTEDVTDLAEAASDAPIVRAVEWMLSEAVKERASDIHIVPEEHVLKIRYRIDGVLHDSATLPISIHSAILTRIKVMADMNIAERRRPLDGSFSDTINNKEVDFRVATIGTIWGESAVLRVLDKSFNLFELEQIGMPEYLRGTYEAALASPFGMIIMSGPTGSGKTTTLYGSLLKLNAKEFNIMSIEDPVEYKFEGVRQIQVNLAAAITFASGLRACMRMDPDVILVGEIRDRETAQTAITAALTGHLVLSSIHANDAVGALIRLVDLGVEPFLVTSGVIATASQRLVRRVCPYCAELKQAPQVDIEAYQRVTGEEKNEFYYGAGCNQCSSTGYHGRIGVFELLPVTDAIRSLVIKQAGVTELKAQAHKDGMLPMSYHGMSLVKEGVTTPSEVARSVFTIG